MKKCKYLIIGAGVSGLSFAGKKQSEDDTQKWICLGLFGAFFSL